MTVEHRITPVGEPRALKVGTLLVRVAGLCGLGEEWRVMFWESPPRPRHGEAWGSGFLHCVNVETGERRAFGPASMVRKEFRQVGGAVVASSVPKKKRSRGFWWNRD